MNRQSLIRQKDEPTAATTLPEGLRSSEDKRTFLRAHIKINKATLDNSVEEQPELFRMAAEGHIHALSERDKTKDELLRVDAREALKLRDEKYKDQKVTESRVNDEVLQSPLHKEAYDKWFFAKQECDEWSVLRDAFDMRGKMLRELVSLYSTGYFGVGGANATRSTYLNDRAQDARERLHQARQGG